MSVEARGLLIETAAAWGLALSETQIAQFDLYAAELIDWNQRINLTAITEPQAIVIRHFLDSLSCALHWGSPPDSLIDIGTGAGFPGLPLKILHPSMRLTLVESVGKKTAFLTHLAERLGLSDVQVLNARAEELGRNPKHRERYRVATARAVADLRVLAEYLLPLVAVGGKMIAPKSNTANDEIKSAISAIRKLGGSAPSVAEIHLPNTDVRWIVTSTKQHATPKHYPREVGMPSRKPLE